MKKRVSMLLLLVFVFPGITFAKLTKEQIDYLGERTIANQASITILEEQYREYPLPEMDGSVISLKYKATVSGKKEIEITVKFISFEKYRDQPEITISTSIKNTKEDFDIASKDVKKIWEGDEIKGLGEIFEFEGEFLRSIKFYDYNQITNLDFQTVIRKGLFHGSGEMTVTVNYRNIPVWLMEAYPFYFDQVKVWTLR
jgi:hypothetical protein